MIKRVLITVVALTTLGLAACGHDDDDHEAKDKSSQTTKSSQSTKSSRSSSSKVAQTLPKQTLDQAWDVFVKAHPDAQVTAVKLDRETGTYRYEITGNVGTTEHEMTINGDTGETIQDEEDSTDDNDPVIKRAGLKPLKDITRPPPRSSLAAPPPSGIWTPITARYSGRFRCSTTAANTWFTLTRTAELRQPRWPTIRRP
ncbi:PepSY domain-containing protein [Lacticaseibacillus camelliae]|uniref:PepSY domain-containing protein n=1 Tax=Lacticaseibacillus camelliae TaxID=381742 RepID=UPI0006CFE9BF|nr:PepSY domain-containing protein [Lacticaseibacillus camelliae]